MLPALALRALLLHVEVGPAGRVVFATVRGVVACHVDGDVLVDEWDFANGYCFANLVGTVGTTP